MNNLGLFVEYEEVLLGKKTEFSASYIGAKTSQKDLLSLFRYAVENLLGWTADVAKCYLNKQVIECLHLSKPLSKLNFPAGIPEEDKPYYMLTLLYPGQLSYSKKNMVLRIYEKVLSGELSKYPKSFFLTRDGELNANICMQYALNHFFKSFNVKTMYHYFADQKKGEKFLRNVKLFVPYKDIYDCPLDMLHNSLPPSKRMNLLYHYLKFQYYFETIKKGGLS